MQATKVKDVFFKNLRKRLVKFLKTLLRKIPAVTFAKIDY